LIVAVLATELSLKEIKSVLTEVDEHIFARANRMRKEAPDDLLLYGFQEAEEPSVHERITAQQIEAVYGFCLLKENYQV
jgi:hypothetical protein